MQEVYYLLKKEPSVENNIILGSFEDFESYTAPLGCLSITIEPIIQDQKPEITLRLE